MWPVILVAGLKQRVYASRASEPFCNATTDLMTIWNALREKFIFDKPPKESINYMPLYTNDSDDSSLPNTDMSLSSTPTVNGRVRTTFRIGKQRHYRDIVTPGEDVMIFWTQLGLFQSFIQFDMATFVVGSVMILFNFRRSWCELFLRYVLLYSTRHVF